MTDVFTPAKRSSIMTRIRSRDTTPELLVRKVARLLGHRFNTYGKVLPGKPDIAIPKHKIAIFVHGCFWHQHKGCKRQFLPKSNQSYWHSKLQRNVERFKEVQALLRKSAWQSVVIWECQTKEMEKLRKIVESKLSRKTQ